MGDDPTARPVVTSLPCDVARSAERDSDLDALVLRALERQVAATGRIARLTGAPAALLRVAVAVAVRDADGPSGTGHRRGAGRGIAIRNIGATLHVVGPRAVAVQVVGIGVVRRTRLPLRSVAVGHHRSHAQAPPVDGRRRGSDVALAETAGILHAVDGHRHRGSRRATALVVGATDLARDAARVGWRGPARRSDREARGARVRM